MTRDDLTQLVVFHTELTADRFAKAWEPTATSFLAGGLSMITLAAFAPNEHEGIGFVSRNTWPAADYRRAFPRGLAADGAAGPITVRQGGAFSVHPASEGPVAVARPDLDLSLCLLHAHPDEAAEAITTLVATLPAGPARHTVVYQAAHLAQRYQVAVTVHGPRGTGGSSTADLRASAATCPAMTGGVFLTGRELLSLPS